MIFPFRRRAPFQLDRGLYMENTKCLLPWNASLESLSKIASPEFVPHAGRSRGSLCWKAEAVLGGIEADVRFGVGGVKNSFDIIPLNLKQFSSPREAFAFYRDNLTPKLGKPNLTPNTDVLNIEYPRAQWWFGNVRVSVVVGERFMEYFGLGITKGLGKR